MNRVALITGITGQDGSYLAEFLLAKGYSVHGIVRDTSATVVTNVTVHRCDLADGSNLDAILASVAPDEVYNLAAQSHVPTSFEQPEQSANINGLGAVRMLQAVRMHQRLTGRSVRFFQASTSAMFNAVQGQQNEQTAIHPRNPYACAKAFAYWQTINDREAHGLFACNGILFNHESPRRPEQFVSRKITRAAARIKLGLQDKLAMGSLDAKRDWGFAGDYVAAMWLMLQHEIPDDYVIATGRAHSVGDFVAEAFGYLGLNWRDYVELDPQFARPADTAVLCGDASKIRRVLGWEPKVGFRDLVRQMVDHDLETARGG